MITVAPVQANTLTALRKFLVSILPSDVSVLQAQVNRVPEPKDSNFVLMTPIRQERIETNVDTYADCAFTASVAGKNMTVTAVGLGIILINATLFGENLTGSPTIVSQTSGPAGGPGVYVLSGSQGTIASQQMASGKQMLLQPTKVTIQLDVHGPAGGDNAQIISTLFRDEYATLQFQRQMPSYDVVPLIADDPRQVPFINAENQYEDRWIVEAMLQANAVVNVPQEFADKVVVQPLIPADIFYPP